MTYDQWKTTDPNDCRAVAAGRTILARHPGRPGTLTRAGLSRSPNARMACLNTGGATFPLKDWAASLYIFCFWAFLTWPRAGTPEPDR